jgi:hypothetical protein
MHYHRRNEILFFCCVAVALCLAPRSGTDEVSLKNSETKSQLDSELGPGLPLTDSPDKSVRKHDSGSHSQLISYGHDSRFPPVATDGSNFDSHCRTGDDQAFAAAVDPAMGYQANQLPQNLEKCRHVLGEALLHAEVNFRFSSSMIESLGHCQSVMGMIVEMALPDNDNRIYDSYHDQDRVLDPGSVQGSHHYEVFERKVPASILHTGPKDERISHLPATLAMKGISHFPRASCEETVCQIRDLKRKCEFPKDRASKQSCRMCYPRTDMELIHAHCSVRRTREVRIFYFVSILFIVASLGSGLAVFLRSRYRRLRDRRSMISQKRKSIEDRTSRGSQDLHTAGRRIQILWLGSGDHNGGNHGRQMGEQGIAWTDDDVDNISIEKNNWTAQQHRWQQKLGLTFSRRSRKRIQDLFDLESLKPSRRDGERPLPPKETEVAEAERIPVLPWAPNASLRLSSIRYGNSNPTKGCLKRSYSNRANDINDLTGLAAKRPRHSAEMSTASGVTSEQPSTLPEIRVQKVSSQEGRAIP